MSVPTPNPLSFTGERFVPGDAAAKGEMWYEHWHRYHFVRPLVTNKTVLDVACGEGYGSALLSGSASHVTGVDISADAIAHGRRTYADRVNLKLIEASCLSMPFDAASFDFVISFETIEHIHEQAEFLDEIKRVLKPDGILVLSSPNKTEYSDKRGFENEFHVKELTRPELESLLAPRFSQRRWLSQRNAFVSVIEESSATALGESLAVSQAAPSKTIAPLPALYDIAFACNDADAIAQIPTRVSTFTDAEEWAFTDYRDTYKGFRHYMAREKELEARCALLQSEIARLQQSSENKSPSSDSWVTRLVRRIFG